MSGSRVSDSDVIIALLVYIISILEDGFIGSLARVAAVILGIGCAIGIILNITEKDEDKDEEDEQ